MDDELTAQLDALEREALFDPCASPILLQSWQTVHAALKALASVPEDGLPNAERSLRNAWRKAEGRTGTRSLLAGSFADRVRALAREIVTDRDAC
ncbi:MAG: hypothetical protein H6834_11035 [Planctomycetes bacterium]|nr:hypothetical protein [Planctomycetota bacterium]